MRNNKHKRTALLWAMIAFIYSSMTFFTAAYYYNRWIAVYEQKVMENYAAKLQGMDPPHGYHIESHHNFGWIGAGLFWPVYWSGRFFIYITEWSTICPVEHACNSHRESCPLCRERNNASETSHKHLKTPGAGETTKAQ